MKSFLFANVPLSVVHFILVVIFGRFLAWPGTVVAGGFPPSPDASIGFVLSVPC